MSRRNITCLYFCVHNLIDAWLAQPGRLLAGNKMTFVGVLDLSDRADLIACLLEVTGVE